MPAKWHFEVLVLGVPEPELRIVRTAFLISQGRARAYTLAADPTHSDPDVLLVDGESDAALARRAANDRWRTAPALFLGKGDAGCARSAVMSRPLVPTRLLASLDDVTRRFGALVPGLIRRPPDPT